MSTTPPPGPLPDTLQCEGKYGYALNVPAEWQMPNTKWWQTPSMAQYIVDQRAQLGIHLQDAAWAVANGEPEPSPNTNAYNFDPATQTYTRR
jgi:hypothetical protein